jgi:hypothetical protein
MKKFLRKLTLMSVAIAGVLTAKAQQVATFENLTLAPNSYWDGSTTKIKTDSVKTDTTFLSGDAVFPNTYNVKGYKYWTEGWAYSNKTDKTTAGFTNMYSAVTAGGYNSANYAIGKDGSILRLNANAKGGKVNGLYVTNGTYAALSMRDGDGPGGLAKKFGDSSSTNAGTHPGTYPDWFKLTIKGYSNGSLKTEAVDFYLADYRFADNSKDYIVTTWEWVDLTPLGNVDSLIFQLSSTDNNSFGMLTPGYFCIDDFKTAGIVSDIATANKSGVKMYPNPATDQLIIDLTQLYTGETTTVDIVDMFGKRIEKLCVNSALINLSVADYKAGAYLISVKNDKTVINAKFIKN